jgi:phasin family protein
MPPKRRRPLLAARTFEDVMQLNTAFAKASFERMVMRSAKLSEMGVKLADEALVPLGGRVAATLRDFGRVFFSPPPFGER